MWRKRNLDASFWRAAVMLLYRGPDQYHATWKVADAARWWHGENNFRAIGRCRAEDELSDQFYPVRRP